MNVNVMLLFSFGVIITSCSVPPGADVDERDSRPDDGATEIPQNMFEGTWTWIKTVGDGVGGHYEEDSASVGYAVHYKFGHDDLQTFKNNEESGRYNYFFTYNEGNPLGSLLELKLTENDSESFFYSFETKDEIRFLILKNIEPCCDNAFEMTFKYIGLKSN